MPLAIPFLFIVLAIGGMAVVSLSQPFGSALTGWLKSLGLFGTVLVGPVASLTVGLARWISNRVGAAILDATGHVVGWFGALYGIIAHVFTSALMWPIEMLRFQEWLLTRGIPRIVRSLTHGSTTILTVGAKRLDALARAIVAAERFVLGRIRPVARAAAIAAVAPVLPYIHWLRQHVAALAHAIPRAIPWHYPRDWSHTLKRIKRLERLLAAGVGVAAVVAALARLGLSWIRCRNVTKAGKAVCGLDTNLLDSLLLDAVAIFSVLSVVEFAKELRTVEDEALTIMGKLVREWPG